MWTVRACNNNNNNKHNASVVLKHEDTEAPVASGLDCLNT